MDVRAVDTEEPGREPGQVSDLFRTHAGRLGRLAYLIAGIDTAEDIVATVFTRLARRGAESLIDPAAYLTRAVVNEAISQRRRWRRDQRLVVRLRAEPTDVGLGARELLDALSVLNRLERSVVVLHYYEDRSIDDVAALLELPRGTVASAQSRALAKLRRTLEP